VSIAIGANLLSQIGCGGGSATQANHVADAALVDAGMGGNTGLLWSFGGGNQNMVAVVQDRSHTLYAGVCAGSDAGAAEMCSVVALDSSGHVLWQTALGKPGLVGLVANGAGNVWAQGESLARIGASGAVTWANAPASLGGEALAVALAPDGTYLQYTQGSNAQLAIQAIGPQGTVRWSASIGGHTTAGDSIPPTSLQAPSVDSVGHVNVPCQPCADGRIGIAQMDVATGTLLSVAVVPNGDAGALPSDTVTCDGLGNAFFETGPLGAPVLASSDQGGIVRWTAPGVRAPALVGATSVTASSVASGFALVALSAGDGGALGTTPLPKSQGLAGLLAGGLRMTSGSFPVAGSSFITATGTVISDGAGSTVWSDATMDPSTAIPDTGRVYGIEKSDTGIGTLVAIGAPIMGVEQSAWPLVRHDPGRTGSAAGTW
jgi:hypothetical protein